MSLLRPSRRGARHEVLAHRPGLGRRPRGRARDPRAPARPSARTTAWSARRARARGPPAAGAGSWTRSTARSTSSTGFAAWAVSMALEDADGLAVGVVHQPGRRGDASAPCAARAPSWAGARIHVTGCPTLDRAMVATGFSYEPTSGAPPGRGGPRLLPRVRDIRRAGAAALDLAWVACGRVDAFFERGLKRWDWAAGRLLVEEAGGVVADWRASRPACWRRRRRS